MQPVGIDFIDPTLFAVSTPRSIFISKFIIINTRRDSTRIFCLNILLILIITPFLLLVASRPTVTILLFITHVIYSVFLHSFYYLVTFNSSIHEVLHNSNRNLPVLSQVYSTHSKCRVSYMKWHILGRYYLSVPR